MIAKKLLCVAAVMLAAAVAGYAQEQPNTVAAIEFQTPKNGMVKQYEEGRKQKVEWHKQQKDTQGLYVFQTLTGDDTGTYLIARFGQHWPDFDKPSVPDAADLEQYEKLIGGAVEKLTASYYEDLAKYSNPAPELNAKYTEVITFHIRYGRGDDFRSAIMRIHEAREKMKSPWHYSWHRLVDGGPGGIFVLTIDHADWASFGDDPAIKPLREDLRAAFGEQEATSVIERLNASIESTYSSIIQFRPDLSYIPAK
ncbi:MAG: hypothetical protein WB680_18635 [Candidatus Acidiferrales bacterium]